MPAHFSIRRRGVRARRQPPAPAESLFGSTASTCGASGPRCRERPWAVGSRRGAKRHRGRGVPRGFPGRRKAGAYSAAQDALDIPANHRGQHLFRVGRPDVGIEDLDFDIPTYPLASTAVRNGQRRYARRHHPRASRIPGGSGVIRRTPDAGEAVTGTGNLAPHSDPTRLERYRRRRRPLNR